MPRTQNRLPALKVNSLKEPGLHSDGGGLYLQIAPGGSKSWKFRYTFEGRVRDMGLGPLADVSLADARDQAAQHRKTVRQGTDPLEERKRQRDARALEAARAITFKDYALMYIEGRKSSWRSAKHAKQWAATLERFAYPHFGHLPIQDVDTAVIFKALKDIWEDKPETGSRVRERIEAILDAAKAIGFRDGDNPARWRGHLKNLLPMPTRQVRHHPALPFVEVGAFMARLRAVDCLSARALELVILTATRTSEALGARWAEVDMDAGIWTIPAARIKAGKEHRIPLSVPVKMLLEKLAQTRVDEFVFPGGKKGKPLSNMALLTLLKRMDRRDITPHGFRSTFRDWAAEKTHFARDVVEMALAHAIQNKVEAAYRRGDLLPKRMKLMADWASYCESPLPTALVALFPHRNAG